MAGYNVLGFVKLVEFVFMLIAAAEGLNLGLIAGDHKRHSSPFIIKKISKLSPVIINIKSKKPLSLPKLPPKPPLKLIGTKNPGKKLPRSILPPILPPVLPGLPLLPLLPPLLPILLPLPPPLLPLLPPLLPPPLPILPLSLLHPPPLVPLLSPLSIFPHLPSLPKCPLKPLNLLKVKPDLKILDLPKIKIDKNKDTADKLRDLNKKGSLSTADFFKLKKLLV